MDLNLFKQMSLRPGGFLMQLAFSNALLMSSRRRPIPNLIITKPQETKALKLSCEEPSSAHQSLSDSSEMIS